MADPHRERALAIVGAYWERLLRPSLRAQAELLTTHTGRRPAPGELIALAGPTPILRAALRPGVVAAGGNEVACVVVERARGHALVAGPAGLALAAVLAGLPPTALAVVWFDADGVDVVPLLDVVDTGPEGAAINSRGGRTPS